MAYYCAFLSQNCTRTLLSQNGQRAALRPTAEMRDTAALFPHLKACAWRTSPEPGGDSGLRAPAAPGLVRAGLAHPSGQGSAPRGCAPAPPRAGPAGARLGPRGRRESCRVFTPLSSLCRDTEDGTCGLGGAGVTHKFGASWGSAHSGTLFRGAPAPSAAVRPSRPAPLSKRPVPRPAPRCPHCPLTTSTSPIFPLPFHDSACVLGVRVSPDLLARQSGWASPRQACTRLAQSGSSSGRYLRRRHHTWLQH